MINRELLIQLDTPQEYLTLILDQDGRYGGAIEEIAKAYMLSGDAAALTPYADPSGRAVAHERARKYLSGVKALCSDEKTQYLLMYLFWLHCIPYVKRYYSLLQINEDIFTASMKDLTFKLRECVAVHGVPGVFVDWFFLQFDMKLFGIGRLQYEVVRFGGESYSAAGYTLKKDDVVYSCHIPSDGPLTTALCMESFQKAYAFFRKDLKGDVLPVAVSSWLLYPPYQGTVFAEKSNIHRFAGLFDTIRSQSTPVFDDCWRVFGRDYNGSTDDFPVDTSLRRRFVEYLDGGGSFGWGYGILLYDGVQRKIMNR